MYISWVKCNQGVIATQRGSFDDGKALQSTTILSMRSVFGVQLIHILRKLKDFGPSNSCFTYVHHTESCNTKNDIIEKKYGIHHVTKN